MDVYEIKLKVYLLQSIKTEESQPGIRKIIDKTLSNEKKWLEFHQENKYKNYCFDSMYPLEQDKVYKEGNIYTVNIRTIDKDLAQYLNKNISKEYTDKIKCLTTQIRIIPKKTIQKVYSITPCILKTNGYWKNNLSIDDFENRLKSNLIKKYNQINNTKVDEDFELYNSIQFKNKKPCAIKYKDIKLLGDKISLDIADDEISQMIAYMSLGVGIGENNSAGAGFMGFRYL